MLNQLEQKVCKRIIALQDELIEVSSKLVAIDTSDPPGENYDACAKFLATYLKKLTANVEIVQVPPESLPRAFKHYAVVPVIVSKDRLSKLRSLEH